MPELPDVEAILKYLRATSLHKRIVSVKVLDSRIVKGGYVRNLKDGLIGRSFESTKRRGKFIIVKTDSLYCVVLHFGMTGDVRYFKNKDTPEYTIWLTEYPEELPSIALMGPEPLYPDFTLESFQEKIKNRSKVIKTLLMDQRFIAGIGNLYADEILFQAGILPYRRAKNLGKGEIERLHKKIKQVLEEANRFNAQVWKLWHKFIIPHRYGDGVCPKCSKHLESISIGTRTSFFCPKCQR